MPGIVDDLIAPELTRVIGYHRVVEQNDDALGVGAHQHHPTGGPRTDAVAVAMANKMARIAWAMLSRAQTFQPGRITAA